MKIPSREHAFAPLTEQPRREHDAGDWLGEPRSPFVRPTAGGQARSQRVVQLRAAEHPPDLDDAGNDDTADLEENASDTASESAGEHKSSALMDAFGHLTDSREDDANGDPPGDEGVPDNHDEEQVADDPDDERSDDGSRSTAVQRRGAKRGTGGKDVLGAAEQGVAGTGQPLPFLGQIQAAFGAHDVSQVRAHVGDRAARAAHAIGAEAYATGNDVAFSVEPDLFTAAHEAAHVVQQRAGVHLLGGVGTEGDVYEQQADAVAARVVRGQSAADLLGAPTHAATSGTAVQRQVTRLRTIDQSEIPYHPVPPNIELPTPPDPQVAINDNDGGECYELAASEVLGSAMHVDAGIDFVDPRGDPWTLTVDTLVFTNAAGQEVFVPWSDSLFTSRPRAQNFELSGGVYYPLDNDSLTRTYDETNTPEIARAARLVYDVIAELKQQRVEYAELTVLFSGSIAGLGGASQIAKSFGTGKHRPSSRHRRRAPLNRSTQRDTDATSGNKSTTPTRTNKPTGSTKAPSLPKGGVRRPAPRHRASSVKQGTLPRDKNTVYDKSVDVAADVKAINDGKATLGRNAHGEMTATVNGRTYVVESNGTLSPRGGPGFTTLSRNGFKALGIYNKFGNTDRANGYMNNMGISAEDRALALSVWQGNQ